MDWAATPLGPVGQWPEMLKAVVRLAMPNGIAHNVLWGPELVQIYNDAYAALIGDRHPDALGKPNLQFWSELRAINEPIYKRVLAGETITVENAPYPMMRNGVVQTAMFVASYSPILDEQNDVCGILGTAVETTDHVVYREEQTERERVMRLHQMGLERIESALQNAPTFFAMTRGADHEVIFANEAFLQLIGRRKLVGYKVVDAVPETVPQGNVELLDTVFTTGEAYIGRGTPLALQRVEGAPLETRYVDFVYYPYDEDGVRTGVVAHGYDVTEQMLAQQRVEQLLAESNAARLLAEREQARATSVLEGMNDGYFALDSSYVFAAVNRAMERAIGVTRDGLLGRVIWDAFPGTLGGEIERNLRRVIDERTDVHFTTHYAADGLDLVVEADVYPTDDGGLAVFWREVTAEAEARAALAESEARFRAVQDASLSGSVLFKPVFDSRGVIADFEYVYINRAGASMARMKQEDLIGKRLREVFPSSTTGTFERYVRVLARGGVEEWDARFTNDGYDIGLNVQAMRVGDLVYVRFTDITERLHQAEEREGLLAAARDAYAEARAAEEQLRNVFEQAPVAIAVLNGPEHIYSIVSPQYARTPGAGRQLIGRPVRDAFPELGDTDLPAIMDQVYETGVPYHRFEQRVMLDTNRDGTLTEHWFNIGYQPLRDASGDVYAIASVAYDVTEQMRARQQIDAARAAAEAAQLEAEKANKAKGEFLAVMSHELRTPLNAIGGYAELIEIGVHGPVTDAQRTALSRIQQSQRHLLGLINGVLNYSRVEAGAITYDLAPVPVQEAVLEAESLVAPQLRTKGLEFHWHGCDTDLGVQADREKLQQILLNLLSNAIKFTDSRGGVAGRIDVFCEPHGTDVHLLVRDTGDGIEPDKLRTVFEPFVQIDQRLTRRQEGVGLGLTISRDLARGMGGDLIAASVVGEGSTFTLVLPMVLLGAGGAAR